MARAPFCIFLLTSRMCRPSRVGNSEVRNANPLISPFTLIWPRIPQSLAASNGTWMMIQLRRERMRSSWASKCFAAVVGLALEAFGMGGNQALAFQYERTNAMASPQELNCTKRYL